MDKASPVSGAQALFSDLDELQSTLNGHHDDPQVERAVSLCVNAGFSVLGVGGRRLAVELTPTKVAKLAFASGGLGDNRLELALWRQADEQLRYRLAPTLGQTPGGVNLQSRCLPVASEALAAPQELTRLLARAGITDAAVNLGMLERRAVCYDYALVRPELARQLLEQE